MDGLRVGVSAVLGVLVTLSLVFVMFKLIDSGNKELDDQEGIKIPDFLHVERDRTENAKMTEVEKPDEPEEMPDIPEEQMEFEAPENVVNMAAPKAGGNLKIGNSSFFEILTLFLSTYHNLSILEVPKREAKRVMQ